MPEMPEMNDDLRFADVVEGVRAALAAYTQALDDGRAADVVATFAADGAIELPGMGTHTGPEQLLAAYTSWAPRRPQRHLVLNTLVTEWSQHEAHATSDIVFILLGKEGWGVQLVGRYRDLLRRDGDAWKFVHRTAEFITPGDPK